MPTGAGRSYPQACEKFAKAAELDPNLAPIYLNWATALALMGKRSQAVEKLDRAAELKPELKPQIEKMRKELLGSE